MRRRGPGFHPPHRRRDLQRALFHWFGVAIVMSGLAAMAVNWAFGPGPGFREEMQRARGLIARLFAAEWREPEARTRLARALAEEGALGLTLSDAQHRPFERHGPPCRAPMEPLAVHEGGELLGYVSVCLHRQGHPFWLLGLLAAGFTLWLLSRKVAVRLARPLIDLTRTARELANGRLDARATLRHPHVSELAVLADSFNHMAARIERQISEQKQLLATVSHELRTPLTRMRLLLELLRERGPSEQTAKTLDELEAEIMEIDELVGQTLASSRLDFAALQPRMIEVRALCERALSRAGLAQDKLSLPEGAKLEIEADPTLLARALANLLGNAEKHAGGVERLEVREEASELCIEVLDRGDGIASELGARLFDPFTRGAGADAAGLGLGLSLVKRIAEAHGGRVWARPRAPHGACVGFSVARRPARSADADGGLAAASSG